MSRKHPSPLRIPLDLKQKVLAALETKPEPKKKCKRERKGSAEKP